MSRDFNVKYDYSETDSYIRMIRKTDIMPSGEVTAAAFKRGSGGCSVTRSDNTHIEQAVQFMYDSLSGLAGMFPVKVCNEGHIHEEYEPSLVNRHHWGLYADSSLHLLTEEQINILVNNVIIID